MIENYREKPLVMLIEDNTGDQILFRSSFSATKVESDLVVVDSGESALEYFKNAEQTPDRFPKPDLIVLDLNMPGMGGKEFLKRLKILEKFNDIPVVVLTTSDSDIDIIESYKLQAAGYIKKPISLNGFIDVINTINKYWLTICKLPNR